MKIITDHGLIVDHAIHVCNARNLLSLLSNGLISYRSGLKSIKYSNDTNQYLANLRGNAYSYDFIINETGPSKYPLNNNSLLINMMKKGAMKRNPWG